MNARAGLRRIVVLGGGIVGHVAAIGFARALSRAEVALVEMPVAPAALADRLPAIDPRGLALLGSLGITEERLVASGVATHRIGQRFDWGADPFVIAEGDGVPTLAGAALHQLWLAYGDGPFDTLMPGAALAAAGRFVHPTTDAGSLSSHFDYTLRLDADGAVPMFASLARAAGVRTVRARHVLPQRRGAALGALAVDGATMAADLFVDASGPDAMLAPPDARWIDWHRTLPADRLLLADGPARPSPTDSYEAVGDGWTARWPLATRTVAGVAYAAGVTNDARMRRLLPRDAERIAIRPRRQAAPFGGGVLALGDAAAATGALGWLGLPLALAQLDLALGLLPSPTDGPAMAAEYNRRAGVMAERMHAYAAAFHLAGGPRAGSFWHGLRQRQAPDELATALIQFGRRGGLPPVEETMISRSMWQQALIGLGIRPERRDPVALSVSPTSAVASLAGLRRAVAALPAALPPYPDYLSRMMRDLAR